MSMSKELYTWEIAEGKPPTTRAFIVGGYGDLFADFTRLVIEAQKDFPDLTDTEISCGKIINSGTRDRHICISWTVKGDAPESYVKRPIHVMPHWY